MNSSPSGFSTDDSTEATSQSPRKGDGKYRSAGPPPMTSHARSANPGSLLAPAAGGAARPDAEASRPSPRAVVKAVSPPLMHDVRRDSMGAATTVCGCDGAEGVDWPSEEAALAIECSRRREHGIKQFGVDDGVKGRRGDDPAAASFPRPGSRRKIELRIVRE